MINQKLMQEVTKTAVTTALEFLEKERQREKQFKRDRRLRNTKLLVRNYRMFKINSQDEMAELKELKDPDSLDFLDTDELVIESIIRNKERTLAMLRYVDRMLEVYRIMAERSSKPEDLRRYHILYDVYIADVEMTPEEIAKGTFCNKRTVYKDLNKACEALSSLIFGIDGIRLMD
jgi:hypothetical protein